MTDPCQVSITTTTAIVVVVVVVVVVVAVIAKTAVGSRLTGRRVFTWRSYQFNSVITRAKKSQWQKLFAANY